MLYTMVAQNCAVMGPVLAAGVLKHLQREARKGTPGSAGFGATPVCCSCSLPHLSASAPCPSACSSHLSQECSERGLAALLAAARHGGAAAAPAPPAAAAAAGGEGGEGGEGEAAMDDLLFYADTQGDATMFGRCAHRPWLPPAACRCLSLGCCRLCRSLLDELQSHSCRGGCQEHLELCLSCP